MLQPNKLKAAIKQNRLACGLLNSIPSALLVEMIGYAGYDFVIIDMEHVGLNQETLEHMLRAAECTGMTSLVRVPTIAPAVIQRVLDCGAHGIVIPHIKNRAEAEQAVAASRFHPLGVRGISGGRTTGFGTIELSRYLELANEEIMVVAMIEDREAVENIDEILSVDGIDLILEGAVDLSQSFGVPGQPQHDQVQQAIKLVAQRCHAHGVPFCAVPRVAGQMQNWRNIGVNTFLLGDDRGIGFRAMKSHLINQTSVLTEPSPAAS